MLHIDLLGIRYFAQHDTGDRSVSICHAERSKAESKHLYGYQFLARQLKNIRSPANARPTLTRGIQRHRLR